MASYSPDASYAPDTRWSWVEIDQGALRYNTRAWRNCIAPRKKMMCVVKADAYGHGAATCAKIMANAGADQFAVATVLEGVALRKAGITYRNRPPRRSLPCWNITSCPPFILRILPLRWANKHHLRIAWHRTTWLLTQA